MCDLSPASGSHPASDPRSELVWYAGYGSNLDPSRFGYYLSGGRPPGSMRATPGARDASPPRQQRAVTLPGRMFFGWQSPGWGGAVSFLDLTPTGDEWGTADAASAGAPATAYLLSAGQLADVGAQEMHREPSADLDLTEVLAHQRHVLGPGHYETLHLVGQVDGVPMLTFTCDDAEHLARNAPSGAYLAALVRGLRGVHGFDDQAVAAYLLACEGAETWAPDELQRLVAGTR